MIGFARLFEDYILMPPKPVAESGDIKEKTRNLREISPGFKPLMPVGSGEDV